jgi:hypothetical protein
VQKFATLRRICSRVSNFAAFGFLVPKDATGLQSGPTSREGNVVVQAIWMVVFGGALDAGF